MYNSSDFLTKNDIFLISEFVKDKRNCFDIGMFPIGNNVKRIIQKEGIKVIYFPIESVESRFSAVYVRLPKDYNHMSFIGINSANYSDVQIFSLAHELYHHYEPTKTHISRDSNNKNDIIEHKANRFASEFLLPTEKFQIEIKEANEGDINLTGWSILKLMRFIAKIHCDFEIPFYSIIHRLKELDSIKASQYNELCKQEIRCSSSDYYKIGLNTSEDVFKRLNSKSFVSGVSANEFDSMFKNYEDNIISSSDLAEALSLFNKTLSDFGLEEEVAEEDLEELKDYF